MKKLFNHLARYFRKDPPAQPPCIRALQEGLSLLREDHVLTSIKWSEVKKIIAYKYDLFGIDEICVGFLADINADSWLEISEMWGGYREAVTMMEDRFPGIPKRWYQDIMVPAFVRKETVLYEKSD